MTDSVSFWRCLVVDHDELEHDDKYNIGELTVGLTDMGGDLDLISFSQAKELKRFGLLLVIKSCDGMIRRGMPFVGGLKYWVDTEYNALSFSTDRQYKGTSLVLGGSYDLGECVSYFQRLDSFIKGEN